VNRFLDRLIGLKKYMDFVLFFCGKSSGFADFENAGDRGSAVNFGVDFGLCLP